jgi:hypothetical protein
MSQQHLDGAQIGARFEHVRCETVPQRVRKYVLADAGTPGGVVHGLPDNLLCNRYVGPPAFHRTWKQIGLGLDPAQYSRRVTNSLELNRTSRSRPPLPWRT